MKIQTINDEKFTQAQAISLHNTYRFDLSNDSATATAVKYDFSSGWTFEIDGGGEVTYSSSEIRSRLEAGTIWKKIGK